MDKLRIEGSDWCQLTANDFDQLVVILTKAGYTVRRGRERKNGKNTGAYTYYVEYWKEKK